MEIVEAAKLQILRLEVRFTYKCGERYTKEDVEEVVKEGVDW